MLPPVFQILKASNEVKAIVGTNPPRIYRHGRVPADLHRPIRQPYITWFLVVGTPDNNLSDPPPSDRLTVQVDCWHPTDSGIDLLAEAVRSALEMACHVTGVIIDEHDTEADLFRIALQADIFTVR